MQVCTQLRCDFPYPDMEKRANNARRLHRYCRQAYLSLCVGDLLWVTCCSQPRCSHDTPEQSNPTAGRLCCTAVSQCADTAKTCWPPDSKGVVPLSYVSAAITLTESPVPHLPLPASGTQQQTWLQGGCWLVPAGAAAQLHHGREAYCLQHVDTNAQIETAQLTAMHGDCQATVKQRCAHSNRCNPPCI